MTQTVWMQLVQALTAVPAYTNPLLPVYEALASERPLTLATLQQHHALWQAQTAAITAAQASQQRIYEQCQHLPPTPLPGLPLGF